MTVISTFSALLGRLPRSVWIGVSLLVALLLLTRWHHAKIDAAFAAGGVAQAAADRKAVTAAATAAEKIQRELRASLAAKQHRITGGVDDELVSENADLVKRYDDLRLRWAAYRADQGGAGARRAIAVSTAASVVDATACPAAGWVSFDTAVAAAQAADTAIARDDAWRTWALGQAAVWPIRQDEQSEMAGPSL